MADQAQRDQQYQYSATASLVLQSQSGRRGRDYDDGGAKRGGNEPTGESESLYGRINAKQMGDRALVREKKDDKKRQKKDEDGASSKQRKPKKQATR